MTEAEVEAAKLAIATIFVGCHQPCQKDRSQCDCAQAAIAALAAAERVRGDGWRTIDSAPKDGTPILVARDMGNSWGWVRGTAYWVDVRGISGWVARGITDPPGELGLGDPTHWQPLPPPPHQDCT